MVDKHQITGLILAGGRGSRMGHVDKGLVMFDNEPMIAHVIRRLAPQVHELIINANRNVERYREFGFPVVSDERSGFEGPLAGLQSGLRHCRTPYLVTVPCDTPFLPDNLVTRLSEALMAQNADLAVAVTGQDTQRQVQSVCCLLKQSLLPQLTDFLASGNRKVQIWQTQLKTVEVAFEDASSFRNVNTPDELHSISQNAPWALKR